MAKKEKKEGGKKVAKKATRKLLKKTGNIPEYHNPTRCDICGHEATVRREGVRCMQSLRKLKPGIPDMSGEGCQGTLVKISNPA